jgi:hypothetical protein
LQGTCSFHHPQRALWGTDKASKDCCSCLSHWGLARLQPRRMSLCRNHCVIECAFAVHADSLSLRSCHVHSLSWPNPPSMAPGKFRMCYCCALEPAAGRRSSSWAMASEHRRTWGWTRIASCLRAQATPLWPSITGGASGGMPWSDAGLLRSRPLCSKLQFTRGWAPCAAGSWQGAPKRC